ncbi:MAG TPA: hypothetical protein VKF37_01320 [Chloroflexota bacterium]|nr:hypothetical protein [Chloroflexota bacterium]
MAQSTHERSGSAGFQPATVAGTMLVLPGVGCHYGGRSDLIGSPARVLARLRSDVR